MRYALVDSSGFGRVRLLEQCQAFAKACGVFVGYGEDADAALGAAGFADKVMAAAVVGVGYGVVYDLEERICHCELRVFSITSTASRTEMV